MSRRLVLGSNEAGAGGGATPPNSVPGLSLWLRADQGITFGSMSPPVHTGSGTIAVGFAGTPVATVQSIEVIINVGGTVGTALFRWLLNGVPQGSLTSAASVPLGATGVYVTFGSGTAVANDTYFSYPTVTTWTSIDGSTTAFVQATAANQPTWIAPGGSGINGQASISFNGASDNSGCVLGNNSYASFAQPFTLFVVGKTPSNPTAQGELVVDGIGGVEIVTNPSTLIAFAGAGSDLTADLTQAFCASALFDGGSSRFPSNTLSHSNCGASSASSGLYLGADSGGGNYYIGLMTEVILFKSPLSVANSNGILQYLQARYAL